MKRGLLYKKNLLPEGANSFLIETTSFQKGNCLMESKQEVTKVMVKMTAESPSLSFHLKIININIEVLDKITWMRRLSCGFAVHIYDKDSYFIVRFANHL